MAENNILDETLTLRRRQTRSRVYNYLYGAGEGCSKQAIANALGLSLPTVYQCLNELLDAGLIDYVGVQPSSGGRPAMKLAIVPDARLSVGISVSEGRFRIILTDLKLNELAYKDVRHKIDIMSGDFSEHLAAELELFLDENLVDRTKLLGVGVSMPAIISPDEKTIVFAPTLNLYNIPIDRLLHAIPYPTHADNDGTCGGFAEWFRSTGNRDIAYLSLEDGVGGAVLINGAQYVGKNNKSGEFGHMCVEPGGLECACGKRGCLEAYCSAKRLSNALGISLSEFFKEIEKGNEEYQTLFYDYLKHLAIGIHNIRLVLDCDVVLGGFMAGFLEPYIPALREMLAKIDPFDPEGSYLHISHHPKHSALMGAALYYVKNFLDGI